MTDMALYESLDQQDRMAGMTSSPSRSTPAPSLTTTEGLVGTARIALLSRLLVCRVLGACAGIVYWSFQGSLLGVVASAGIPGLAAATTWLAFATLEKPLDR